MTFLGSSIQHRWDFSSKLGSTLSHERNKNCLMVLLWNRFSYTMWNLPAIIVIGRISAIFLSSLSYMIAFTNNISQTFSNINTESVLYCVMETNWSSHLLILFPPNFPWSTQPAGALSKKCMNFQQQKLQRIRQQNINSYYRFWQPLLVAKWLG